jgi:hypothetical protein
MKTVCMRHEQAYDVGTCCPWCEPDPPGRAYSFAAPEPKAYELTTPWYRLDQINSSVGVRTFEDVVSRRVALRAARLDELAEQVKKLWNKHDMSAAMVPRQPLILADPECPPGYAYATSFNEADDSYTVKIKYDFFAHPSYICKVKLPE